MKSKLIIIGIAAIMLLSMVCSIPVNAEEADVTMDVYVETEGNVNASFNATAGGNVTYWIDGMEVKSEFSSIWEAFGEFDDVWGFINELESILNDAREVATNAYFMGSSAYAYASDNYDKIMLAFAALLELNETTNKIQSNLEKLNDTINDLKDKISNLEKEMKEEIEKLNATISDQAAQIKLLQSDVKGINELLGSVGNLGIIFVVLAVLACCLYLFNRKYPFGYIIRNGKATFRNSKRHLRDLVRKANKSKKVKSKSLIYKIKHLRRNKEKSPVKFMFSLFQIHK